MTHGQVLNAVHTSVTGQPNAGVIRSQIPDRHFRTLNHGAGLVGHGSLYRAGLSQSQTARQNERRYYQENAKSLHSVPPKYKCGKFSEAHTGPRSQTRTVYQQSPRGRRTTTATATPKQ